MIKNSSGYTVVELLIAMTLISLIAGLGYKSFYFFQQNFSNWQNRMSLEEQTRRVMTAITNDVMFLQEIRTAQERFILFKSADQKLVTYAQREQEVLKNSRSLLSPGMKTEKLIFTYFKSGEEVADDAFDTHLVRSIGVTLVLKNKSGKTFALNSRIALRDHRDF